MNRYVSVLVALFAGALTLSACGNASRGTGDGSNPYTSAALQKTLDIVKGKLGSNAQLYDVTIASGGISYDYPAGNGGQSNGLLFKPGSTDPFELQDTIGHGPTFPVSAVDSSVVDKLVATKLSGVSSFTPVSISLDSSVLDASLQPGLGWDMSGHSAGGNVVVMADPDGSNVRTPGGMPGIATGSSGADSSATGTAGSVAGQAPQLPPNSPQAQRIQARVKKYVACVNAAQGDAAKVQQCFSRYGP
jgi:hypothetical protein